MPRRKRAPKRVILPDPVFRSTLLAKFINSVMCAGKKSLAERIVYGALDIVSQKLQSSDKLRALVQTPSPSQQQEKGQQKEASSEEGGDSSGAQLHKLVLAAFKKALDNVMPSVEVRSRRVGGSTYQVPVEVRASRRVALAMRWLVSYASKRHEKTMKIRLAHEILDALEYRGNAVKKREDVHRMAKANQAFAHYRWAGG